MTSGGLYLLARVQLLIAALLLACQVQLALVQSNVLPPLRQPVPVAQAARPPLDADVRQHCLGSILPHSPAHIGRVRSAYTSCQSTCDSKQLQKTTSIEVHTGMQISSIAHRQGTL